MRCGEDMGADHLDERHQLAAARRKGNAIAFEIRREGLDRHHEQPGASSAPYLDAARSTGRWPMLWTHRGHEAAVTAGTPPFRTARATAVRSAGSVGRQII
jgi:hypothetical protein